MKRVVLAIALLLAFAASANAQTGRGIFIVSSCSSISSPVSGGTWCLTEGPPPAISVWNGSSWVVATASGPASGDLSGNYPSPVVAQIQGIPVSTTAPVTGNGLIFNGTKWVPTAIPTGGGGGGTPSGPASGDLSGSYPSPVVAQIQGRPVATSSPSVGQVYQWNGSAWAPSAPGGPPSGSASGDLTGNYPSPVVAGLRGIPIVVATPVTGQVDAYNGSQWAPITLPTALPPNGAAGGDLSGTYPNPSVAKVNKVNVNGELNVQSFGALGDCSTDDTTSIQNTINAANMGGFGVYFPRTPTCYKFTHLTVPTSMTLRGDSWNADFHMPYGFAGYAPVSTVTTGGSITLPGNTVQTTSVGSQTLPGTGSFTFNVTATTGFPTAGEFVVFNGALNPNSVILHYTGLSTCASIPCFTGVTSTSTQVVPAGTMTYFAIDIPVSATGSFTSFIFSPIYIGGQVVACTNGLNTSTLFTGCTGGTGTFANGTTVFQIGATGSVLYSTATSGVAIDWTSNNGSVPIFPGSYVSTGPGPALPEDYLLKDGGDMNHLYLIGPGTNGSVLAVSSATESSGGSRFGTITTSTAHGVPIGNSTGLIISGVGITACTVTSLSESGFTATVNCSGADGLAVGDNIVSAGNVPSGYNGSFKVDKILGSSSFTFQDPTGSLGVGTGFGTVKNGNYNRTVHAVSTGTNTLSWQMGTFHDLGAGSGGTATLTPIGVSFGEPSFWSPIEMVNSDHLGVGNFGICTVVYNNSMNHRSMFLNGCYTGLYFTNEPNNAAIAVGDTFTNLTITGGVHVGIDMLNSTAVTRIDSWVIELLGGDPTAIGILIGDADNDLIINGTMFGVVPVSGNFNFIGDGIEIRGYNNAGGLTIQSSALGANNYAFGGLPTSHSNIHIVASTGGATSPDKTSLIGVKFKTTGSASYANLIIDSGVTNTYMLNDDVPNADIINNATGQLFGTDTIQNAMYASLSTMGSAPTISSCGSGAAVASTSTNNGGHITVGSTNPTTTCTVTFANSGWNNTPDCTVNDGSTFQAVKPAPTSTTLVISAQTDFHGDTVYYTCAPHT